jgi:hypothetical protein
MKATAKKHLTILAGLSLALLVSLPGTVFADGKPDRHPNVTAVTGQSDWSIVPPAIPSEYVTFHEDGSAAIKRMPLAGNFSLAGDGTTLDATIKGILSADLDPTLSGPIYGPLVVTKKIKGREIVIFEGRFFGRVNGLLASGQIILHGRGHLAGTMIVVSFLETGANTETFVLTGHLFDPCDD